MRAIEVVEEVNHFRRRFVGAAAVTFAAARLGVIGSANANRHNYLRSSQGRTRRSAR